MTVEVTRTFELDYPREMVWEILSDHEKRARAVSIVEDWDVHDEQSATWHLSLPIPLIRRTIAVRTEEVVREPPRKVRFTGESKVMDLVGQHELEELDDGGCRVTNYFRVDGKMPGVERFFKANLDDEIEHLRSRLHEELDGGSE